MLHARSCLLAVSRRQAAIATCAFLTICAACATRLPGEQPGFGDIAAASGISSSTTFGSRDSSSYILETTGTGTAVFDFDNDGDNDILIVNGTTFELQADGKSPPSHLYVNDGHGMFRESALGKGLTARGWGQGACVGDIDNDGWNDLLVTYYGRNILYSNREGTFRTSEQALGPTPAGQWGAGCAFLDYDLDGLLDLFVANYVDFDPESTPKPGSPGACEWKGIPVMCGPRGLPRARNWLYRNLGGGRFADVSEEAGILKPGGRYALGVAAADFDRDGDTDIYVACDMTPSLLYSNNGDGTFTETASEAGVGYNVDGQLQAGMGVAVSDYDGNGYLDIAKTNFSGDLPSLYRNDDGLFFEDVAFEAGLGIHQLLGWGVLFVDADEDGYQDLLIANGHVYPEVDAAEVGETYRQPTVLYRNLGDGTFRDITQHGGPALQATRPARGMAQGDLDGDGRPEIVIANINLEPTVLRNAAPPRNAVLLRLHGTESNRNAIGSTVTLTASGRRLVQAVVGGGSYYSQSSYDLHFGLGDSSGPVSAEVAWTNGLSQTWPGLPANHVHVLTEGVSEPVSKPFRTASRDRSGSVADIGSAASPPER